MRRFLRALLFLLSAHAVGLFILALFRLVGDHGKMVGDPESEIPQSYNHVPLMIYSSQLTPGEQTGFGGQIDIAPTLLGLLNMGYVQNNFSVNLLQTRRPGIFYTADNLMAARDSSSLYVCKEDGQELFYRTAGETTRPVATADKKHLALKKYCFSMLQAAEGLVKQGKTK